MTTWKPDAAEQIYLNTVLSMTIDCLQGKGTDKARTYVMNLKMLAKRLEESSLQTTTNEEKK